MNSFIVCVELNGVEMENSTQLDIAMTGAGFIPTIAGDRSTYFLPTATYAINSTESVSEVASRAISAASETGFSPIIFAAQIGDWWIGLGE